MLVDWLRQNQDSVIDGYLALRQEQNDPRNAETIQPNAHALLDLFYKSLAGEITWEPGTPLTDGQKTQFTEALIGVRDLFRAIRHNLEQQNHPEKAAWLLELADQILVTNQTAAQSMARILETEIAERRNQEAALSETQAFLNTAYEQNPAGIMVFDARTGKIQTINAAAGEIFQVDPNEMQRITGPNDALSMSWQSLHPDGTPYTHSDIPGARILHGETVRNELMRIVRRDGSERWVLISGAPIRNAAGEIIAGMSIFPDITETYQANHELEKAQTLLQAMVEQSPIPTLVASLPDFALKFLNMAALENLGLNPEMAHKGITFSESLTLKKWNSFYPDGTPLPPDQLPISPALQGRTVLNQEIRTILEDGTERWNLHSALPIYDKTGTQIAAMLVFPDITERKQTELELQNWKQRYERIADASNQAVYQFEAQTGQITWSGQIERLLGYSLNEINGDFQDRAQWLHPDDRDAVMNQTLLALQSQNSYDLEYRLRHKNGEYLWIHDRAVCIRDENGQPIQVIGTLQDITRHKQADEERARLQQEIIEAQQRALKELSVPIIPVMDHILVMPLIGSIDTLRARDITRTLLQGISRYHAQVVILDITGVPLVDSGVAAHLNKTIQAARLKGTRTIVTGISDAVAETIVDLGIDWSNIETLRDLQSGLLAALESLGLRLSRSTSKPDGTPAPKGG